MVLIQEVLKEEIDNGWIDWDGLQHKIHTALCLVDNGFEGINEGGKMVKFKVHDGLSFKVTKSDGDAYCYRLMSPRYRQGKLLCEGVKIGRYDLQGKPYFTDPTIYNTSFRSIQG